MRKIVCPAFICCMCALAACDKHDPILPGTRTAIFDTGDVVVMNTTVSGLPDAATVYENAPCPYRQDSSNVIWDGEKKIFSGFPTSNSVKNDARPVCGDGYVYAGLTTGELVKVNPKNRQIAWIADIYKDSNMTGGASVLDIVAPITLDGDGNVYAGGVGDAFCKLAAKNGKKKWCVNVGTALPYVMAGPAVFVMATDGNLYAIRIADGAIYWRTAVKTAAAPEYAGGVITVGREKFRAATGEKTK